MLDDVVSCGDSNKDVIEEEEGNGKVRELGNGVEAISAILDVAGTAEKDTCRTSEDVNNTGDVMEISTSLLEDSATLTGVDGSDNSEVSGDVVTTTIPLGMSVTTEEDGSKRSEVMLGVALKAAEVGEIATTLSEVTTVIDKACVAGSCATEEVPVVVA